MFLPLPLLLAPIILVAANPTPQIIIISSTASRTTANPTPTPSPPARPPNSYTGDAVYTHFGLGSCGLTNTDDQLVVGLSKLLLDNWPGATRNPNDHPLCKRNITASYGGKRVTATIVDTCLSCDEFDLNFSPAAFKDLANIEDGKIEGVDWYLVPDGTATTISTSTSISVTRGP